MGWQNWRKWLSAKVRAKSPSSKPLSIEERLAAFQRNLDAQRIMLDERTRVMADAMSTELRALGRIMADLSRNMAELNAQLEATRAERPVDPVPIIPAPPVASKRVGSEERPRSLVPPPPANDPPAPVPVSVDPMLLDALAKGRVAFELEKIASIPKRAPLLALMRLTLPLPAVDAAMLDRLADLFPDAALLLDRLMIDAAASMIRTGQVDPNLPLLVPLSPVTARDAGQAVEFRRRFEWRDKAVGVMPLLTEAGWIALVEAGQTRIEDLAGPRPGIAIRVSGQRRIDPAALGRLGARYVLAAASTLAANDEHPLAPDIHPADTARLFARAGIGIIAENVPDQVTVLGLLRNNITMGWGPALQAEPSASGEAQHVEEPPSLDYRAYLRRASS